MAFLVLLIDLTVLGLGAFRGRHADRLELVTGQIHRIGFELLRGKTALLPGLVNALARVLWTSDAPAAFVFLNEDVGVVHLVIVVVKLHRATLEGILLVDSLLLLRLSGRHQYAFLEEMSRGDNCVSIQFLVVLDLLNAKILVLCVRR